jgi:hypothetical protein
MTCEVCGNTGHSGNYCPTTQEDVMFMNDNNNNIVHKEVKHGINTLITKDVTKVILSILTNLP